MNQVPLKVENLTKIYEPSLFSTAQERFTAVDGISFDLQPGEILGLLGPNGAGKTTTIHMLLGVTQSTSGVITYFGQDFQKHRSSIMKRVTFASTYSKLLGRLTIYENLAFYAQLYGIEGIEQVKRIEYFLKLFDLWEIRNRRASALSAGESARSLLAKAFLPHPRVVLLDEPTAALDPDIARSVRQFVLEQQREHGVSMLFTSHNMHEVSEVCDRVLVMKNGRIIGRDTPESLAASVATSHIELFSEHLAGIQNYAHRQGLSTQQREHSVVIELDEQQIASFLTGLTKNDLAYTQLSIDKPSLEDYFIEITKKKTEDA